MLAWSWPRVGPGELAGFFKNGCPQSLLLTLPLWAVLEKVFPSLDLVLTPPAGGVWAAGRPREVLPDEAVSRLHLVGPGGEAPVGLRNRGIRFLPVAGPALAVAGAGQHLPSPGLGVLPFHLGKSSLYIGEGPRQREDSPGGRAVRVLGREPFYPVVIRFVGRELGPFIGLSIALDALVAWAPPNLDPDDGLLGPKGGDVLPRFEGVLLPWSRFIGGHPSYCRLAVRQDSDQSQSVVSGCRYLQGSCKGRALSLIGFLGPAHVGLVALPSLAVLPDDGVSGCSVLQTGPVRKDRQPWSVGPLGLARRCLSFLDGGGCIQRGGYFEEDRFLPAVPASQVGLESLAECAIRGSDERRRRLSSCVVAGLSPNSKLRAPWLVVLKAPRVNRASWFTSFWTSSCTCRRTSLAHLRPRVS